MKRKKSLRGMVAKKEKFKLINDNIKEKIMFMFYFSFVGMLFSITLSNVADAGHSSHYSWSKTKSCSCSTIFSPSYNLNGHYSVNVTKTCSCNVTVYASELHNSHNSHWSHWSHGSRR